MHPILFRIPLPAMPLKLWWALAAVCAIAALSAIFSLRKHDRGSAAVAFVVAAGAAIAGWAFRATQLDAQALPIYSYGVMLGLSLIVGWYITLTLADRDGLPRETMANCYIVTALAAVAGARLLYVATNPEEFKELSDVFAMRRGGLVAYGGFLGGFVGSWLYLRSQKIRLMPWADAAVPSLAAGLFITRIGCYLFGCDFGKRLSDTAPAFLKKVGTFPHWTGAAVAAGDGSPAYVKHLETFRGTPLGTAILKDGHSLPVHPTQIYESVAGLALLALLLWQRKHQKFRGQVFFMFAFAYGFARFLIEIVRDDPERNAYGLYLPQHVYLPVALALFAVAFIFGIALSIRSEQARLAARVVAGVVPVAAFLVLKPVSFAKQTSIQLSTSQWIGLVSALVCAYFYAKFWDEARRKPRAAMGPESLGEGAFAPEADESEAPKKKKAKKAAGAPSSSGKATTEEEREGPPVVDQDGEDDDGGDEDSDSDDDAPEDDAPEPEPAKG